MIINKAQKQDPTRTLVLRKGFSAEMYKRFRWLKGEIRTSIVDRDCFGLSGPLTGLRAANAREFAFQTDRRKHDAFMAWLREQQRRGILSTREGPGVSAARGSAKWTDSYIVSGYKQGIQRAYREMQQRGLQFNLPVAATEDFSSAFFLDTVFNMPTHINDAEMLFARTYSELEGITEVMDQRISRALTQGFIEGRNPRRIASTINAQVDNIGLNRARKLARTEIIRAHHIATINSYEEAGLKRVKIKAEWASALDGRVCPDCMYLNGRVFALSEIKSLIPLHPNCRCVALPAGVGEEDIERGKFRPGIVGEQYRRKDGSLRFRDFYKKKTGKIKPPSRAFLQ